ncbi:MAG TPA: FAD/NAD(P)-binding protein [Bacteroidales bacterium]|nr:FAD/NAD(P)-binding protein [Bacteroidales bacterium]HPF03182.1 FAD/NAD(P)-binding protein [Bacteroidales bacterium]HPJ58305.1 FAD/NAD(P)-binding protein [Bacteroidales bacterium]HPR10889.1 FAD/NAD(P)-binding protein [Bacteroidales bacterium]HRW84151.1 FAD/NAD(P)-binding protein [Bacteroidales bacterium]
MKYSGNWLNENTDMPADVNIYKALRAELTEVITESPLIKTFVLIPEKEFFFDTGQFIELAVDGIGEAPFTPSSSPLVHDRLEVTVMKTGYVTEYMHNMKPGDLMGIRGPYGRGYPVEKFFGKEVLILGGGCGLAPIRSLLYALEHVVDKLEKVTLCYGSKTPSDCVYKPLFARLNKIDKFETFRTVDKPDDEWNESVGVVTSLLNRIHIDIDKSVAVVCGPPVMMKFTTIRLLEMGYPENKIYLSMEKNMSCGLGKCGHCMMGKFFVCKDGPVFTYNELKDTPDIWS